MFIYWRKTHFKKKYPSYFYAYYKLSEVLSWKSFWMHQKDAFMLRSRICMFRLKHTDFVWCDMTDVIISYALCIEKNIVYCIISFREGWYGFRNPQCCNPEHQITLCEINSIKSDNIDGYLINRKYIVTTFEMSPSSH